MSRGLFSPLFPPPGLTALFRRQPTSLLAQFAKNFGLGKKKILGLYKLKSPGTSSVKNLFTPKLGNGKNRPAHFKLGWSFRSKRSRLVLWRQTKLKLHELLSCASPTHTPCTVPQGDGIGWINMNRFTAGQQSLPSFIKVCE